MNSSGRYLELTLNWLKLLNNICIYILIITKDKVKTKNNINWCYSKAKIHDLI